MFPCLSLILLAIDLESSTISLACYLKVDNNSHCIAVFELNTGLIFKGVMFEQSYNIMVNI